MDYICLKCNKILIKKSLHGLEYYKCEYCQLYIKKESISHNIDKENIALFAHAQKKLNDISSSNYEYINLFLEHLAEHVENYEKNLDLDIIGDFIEVILESNNIFITALGRSRLVGKSFIMRLVSLGLKSFSYNDTISPSIKKGDCLIAISGSGETKTVLSNVKIAKEKGCKILLLTDNHDSSLGKLSDLVWIIEGKQPVSDIGVEERIINGEYIKITPLGTLFELTSGIMLESFMLELNLRLAKTES
ncbi:MAG: SIS domain-containing protein [Methanobrevibacter sp.]|nr:SIS domain-containing protein [Candidatus Methanovirga basalitermitum]